MAIYDSAAAWYDRVWGPRRDHAADVEAIIRLVEERAPDAQRLLDVGCATGEHLRHLVPRFGVAGVDVSAGLLEVARRKLGDSAVLHEADMLNLDLGERFDVVICLWGTVAYATTPRSLATVAATIDRHLSPGGVAIVEPWLTPEAFDATGRVNVVVDDGEAPVLTVVSTTRRDGDVAQLRRLYVAATADELATVEETHELGLFDETAYRSAFDSAGLDTEWLTEGLTGRGLLVATKGRS